MERKQFTCIKCGNHHYESDQFQATGGNFAKFFDIQNKKFVTVLTLALIVANTSTSPKRSQLIITTTKFHRGSAYMFEFLLMM